MQAVLLEKRLAKLQDFLKENNQKELSMHEQMMLRQAEAEL